jgi:hypothetical protein
MNTKTGIVGVVFSIFIQFKCCLYAKKLSIMSENIHTSSREKWKLNPLLSLNVWEGERLGTMVNWSNCLCFSSFTLVPIHPILQHHTLLVNFYYFYLGAKIGRINGTIFFSQRLMSRCNLWT